MPCGCEFRMRRWNPASGLCESCGLKFDDHESGQVVLADPLVSANERLRGEVEKLRADHGRHVDQIMSALCEHARIPDKRDRFPLLIAWIDEARADHAEAEKLWADLAARDLLIKQMGDCQVRLRNDLSVCNEAVADLASVETILLRAIPHTDGAGDDPSHVPVSRIAEDVVRDLADATKVVEAVRAWSDHDRGSLRWSQWHQVIAACLHGEKPEERP